MKHTDQHDGTQKKISYRRLAIQSLPVMWTHHLVAGLLIMFSTTVLRHLMGEITAGAYKLSGTFSTAIAASWRIPALLIVFVMLISVTIVIEFFPHILLANEILEGHKANVWHEMYESLRSLKKFRTPTGALILLFVYVFMPLIYLGISVLLSRSFHVSADMVGMIMGDPIQIILYAVLMCVLGWVGFRTIFVVPAVLIDDRKPIEAYHRSLRLVQDHRKTVLFELAKAIGVMVLLMGVSFVLFTLLPEKLLEEREVLMPRGYMIDLFQPEPLSEADLDIVLFRVGASFAIIMGAYMNTIAAMIALGYYMMRVTRLYLFMTGRGKALWPERPDKTANKFRLALIALTFLLIGVGATISGAFYIQLYFQPERVTIIDDSPQTLLWNESEGKLSYHHENLHDWKELNVSMYRVGIGKIADLPCEAVILLEEQASLERIARIQDAGKKVIIWIDDRREGTDTGKEGIIRKYLDSRADFLITEDSQLAKEIQKELDHRTDLEIIEEQLGELFE